MVTTTTPPPAPPPSAESAASDAPKRRVFRHPWRVAIVAGVLLVVVNLGAVLLAESDTDSARPTLTDDGQQFPAVIEGVAPFPGSLLSPQDTIRADLQNDYTGILVVDPPSTPAFEVPEDQLDRVRDLGQVGFRPGEDKELTRFEPGIYTATIEYWPQKDERPARPESFSWTFRVGA